MNWKTVLRLAVLLALIGVAIYLWMSDPYSTVSQPQADFVIEDTAAIGKIFIADTYGRSAVIERNAQDDGWILNDTFKARQDAADLLLKTFKRMYIREPVAKESREQVLKLLAAHHRKVEVFDRNGKWIKTYYVGQNTRDNKGTYMLLETPQGRSSEPYVTDMKGFTGTLYTRFFTNEGEWRSTEVFKYALPDIKRIDVNFPEVPRESFTILYGGGNQISLLDTDEKPLKGFDTLLVKDYMLNFKGAYFEVFESYLNQQSADSVLRSTPLIHISVADGDGEIKEVKLFRKLNNQELEDDQGRPYPFDPEYFYGTMDGKELALGQVLQWDKFTVPLSAFRSRNPI